MLKSPFLHSVENWIKCDDTILLQQGATPMHIGKGGGSVMEDQLGGKCPSISGIFEKFQCCLSSHFLTVFDYQ